MNISDVRMEKIRLEKCIAGLLAEFEAKTSVTIMSIEVDSMKEKNIFQDSRHKTTIRIEL